MGISRREGGQLLPLVAAVMALVMLGALALVRVGVRASHEASATAAAEAAALAAAEGGGEPAARHWADLNGGRLVSFATDGPVVTVVVQVGGVEGTARAAGSTGAGSAVAGIEAGLRAALARVGQLLGAPVPVVAVAEGGLAVDVGAASVARVVSVAEPAGLCRPDPDGHPARFDVCNPPPLGTNLHTSQPPEPALDGRSPPDAGPESPSAEE